MSETKIKTGFVVRMPRKLWPFVAEERGVPAPYRVPTKTVPRGDVSFGRFEDGASSWRFARQGVGAEATIFETREAAEERILEHNTDRELRVAQGDSRYAGTWPLEHYDIADTTDRLKLAEREAELERAKKRLELQKRVAKYEDAQRAAEEARRELKALDAKGTSQDAVVEPAKSTSSSWATVPGHPGIQARTQADGTIRYRARHAGKVSKTLATLEEAQSEYTAMGGEAPTQRSSVLSPFDVERMGL